MGDLYKFLFPFDINFRNKQVRASEGNKGNRESWGIRIQIREQSKHLHSSILLAMDSSPRESPGSPFAHKPLQGLAQAQEDQELHREGKQQPLPGKDRI